MLLRSFAFLFPTSNLFFPSALSPDILCLQILLYPSSHNICHSFLPILHPFTPPFCWSFPLWVLCLSQPNNLWRWFWVRNINTIQSCKYKYIIDTVNSSPNAQKYLSKTLRKTPKNFETLKKPSEILASPTKPIIFISAATIPPKTNSNISSTTADNTNTNNTNTNYVGTTVSEQLYKTHKFT